MQYSSYDYCSLLEGCHNLTRDVYVCVLTGLCLSLDYIHFEDRGHPLCPFHYCSPRSLPSLWLTVGFQRTFVSGSGLGGFLSTPSGR